MDVQKLINAMNDVTQNVRSEYHLTLGRAIEVMEKIPETATVRFDWEESFGPSKPHSYRGYYSDLAFGTVSYEVTADYFLDQLKESLGAVFEGYKGGMYTMDKNTPLWVADYGSCGRAIIAWYFDDDEQELILITKEED